MRWGRTRLLKRFLSIPKYEGASRRRIKRGVATGSVVPNETRVLINELQLYIRSFRRVVTRYKLFSTVQNITPRFAAIFVKTLHKRNITTALCKMSYRSFSVVMTAVHQAILEFRRKTSRYSSCY